MFRYRKSRNHYFKSPKPKECPFCHREEQGKLVEKGKYSSVIENKFPYDFWELSEVTDHVLVIPNRHIKSLAEANAHERKEIMDFIADYEVKGYNVYARSADSVKRTVALHQHTHLIKTVDHGARVALFLKKPYFFWKI